MLTKTTEDKAISVEDMMRDLGSNARRAAAPLAKASTAQKNKALLAMAESLEAHIALILEANAQDLKAAEASGMAASFVDRLTLNQERINAMAAGILEIAALEDPVGSVIAQWTRPNGLDIQRVRTPLGVIGVIYESRPNVTADAGALCLKAGNAVILRGGSDSIHSSGAIHACMVEGLKAADLPEASIQRVPTTDRAAVGEMLKGLDGNMDVIVPRGGKGLVGRVQSDARVPVFAHLEGLCHVYIDASAKAQMAIDVTVNAKTRRTGICGSAETVLFDQSSDHMLPVLEALNAKGVEIRGCEKVCAAFPSAILATEDDWTTEYLDMIISARIVDGINGAIDHIRQYSSSHTEAVIAEDAAVVERFFNEVDSAILLHNASTQFADGGEFGMGAEIGIATGKMHARGPVGVEQLTSFNYRVRGSGQIRPL